jgi:preprotein translocase subunit Sec63
MSVSNIDIKNIKGYSDKYHIKNRTIFTFVSIVLSAIRNKNVNIEVFSVAHELCKIIENYNNDLISFLLGNNNLQPESSNINPNRIVSESNS